jgi:RNA polymerase sigma factor (sigma-70 family)
VDGVLDLDSCRLHEGWSVYLKRSQDAPPRVYLLGQLRDTCGGLVVNREETQKRPLHMTSRRRHGPAVLELVEGPTRTSGAALPAAELAVAALESLESFEDFYRREYSRLLVLARALVGDLAAEDVAQESMVVAYRDWSRISALSSPAGYVRGICAHKAVSVTRRLLTERRALRRAATRAQAAVQQLPDDTARFWAEVRRLPRRQAQTVALFYALDLPVAEVAATLGCAEGTVKVHLSRARKELASRLGATEEQP